MDFKGTMKAKYNINLGELAFGNSLDSIPTPKDGFARGVQISETSNASRIVFAIQFDLQRSFAVRSC